MSVVRVSRPRSTRLRSELEADVTEMCSEMMKRVHLGVKSRFSPKAILILRKIARGWGGILESPPWGRNEPTGHSGPLGRPHQVRGRMPCDLARTGSGSRGHRNTVTTRFKSRRPGDVPYTRWQLRVVGLGRRDGPLGTATLYHLRSITQWVLKSSNGRKAQCACARS